MALLQLLMPENTRHIWCAMEVVLPHQLMPNTHKKPSYWSLNMLSTQLVLQITPLHGQGLIKIRAIK